MWTTQVSVTPWQAFSYNKHDLIIEGIEQSEEILNQEIIKSHVVCIVYAVDDDDTLDRITSHWLPLLREAVGNDQPMKPVVLVGNKVDLVEYSTINVSQKTIFLFLS